MSWEPISQTNFEKLLEDECGDLQSEEKELFDRTAIQVERRSFAPNPFLADAFVVAQYRGEIMYYNDIEGRFNTSPCNEKGVILEYWCSQDSLNAALHRWLYPSE